MRGDFLPRPCLPDSPGWSGPRKLAAARPDGADDRGGSAFLEPPVARRETSRKRGIRLVGACVQGGATALDRESENTGRSRIGQVRGGSRWSVSSRGPAAGNEPPRSPMAFGAVRAEPARAHPARYPRRGPVAVSRREKRRCGPSRRRDRSRALRRARAVRIPSNREPAPKGGCARFPFPCERPDRPPAGIRAASLDRKARMRRVPPVR